MSLTVAWIVLILIIGGICYYRCHTAVWVPASLVVLVAYSEFAWLPVVALIILWLVWLLIVAFVLLSGLRRQLITRPVMHWFRQQQPKLSTVEEQVLEAGDVWWEQQFFTGKPNWKKLFTIKKSRLSVDEQAFVDQQARHLCSLLDDWQITQNQQGLPQAAWDYIKQEKFWGMVIDKQYGGLGFSAAAHSTVVCLLASRSLSAALTVMVPNSLGPAEFVERYGTEQQKQYYLPRLATGEDIPCFGLTEPTAGSDASNIQAAGVVCRGQHDGKEVLGIRLNWSKRYITLAPIATLIGLAFKLHDPDHLLGDTDHLGITLALVPANTAGVESGKLHYPSHHAFLNGPIVGRDVFIPLDFIIGGVERCGQGWRMLMECLAVGRSISLPALSTGITQQSFAMSAAYAVIREQFNRSIGEFEGIQQVLARLAGYSYLCQAVRLLTAEAVDAGIRPSIASAISKCYLTQIARDAVDDAMDIHAGRSLLIGPRNYMTGMHDFVPVGVNVEGANILTRNLIIFGQGVVRCHPYLFKEIAAAMHADKDKQQFVAFDKAFVKHIGFSLSNVCRMIVMGLTGGHLVQCSVKKRFAKYAKQLTRMSSAYAVLVDVVLLFVGKNLKIKEALSGRLADMVAYFYMASAVLKYFNDQGLPEKLWPIVRWNLQYCLAHLEEAMREFLDNFPTRWLAVILKRLIFPWGQCYHLPRDQDSLAIAQVVQKDEELYAKLSSCSYIGDDASDITGRMHQTWRALLAIEPIMAKVKLAIQQGKVDKQQRSEQQLQAAKAQGIINEADFQQCQQAFAMRDDAVQVDVFEKDGA